MGKLSRRDLEETVSTFGGYSGAKGSIVRLKVEDFMTYRNVEMKAGPHVNLIMGPNGTGKSTIVCAICLGLAGKPKILGRAHSLKEYIRHGAHRASVEIELFNPDSLSGTGSNWVVKRVLDDSHGGSTSTEWFINERKCRENQVEKLMKSLNIQLDNLCQFLPQDRVQDFAKMDSIQLLRSTEQSIDNDHGDHLGDKHEQLIQMKNDIADLRKRLKNSDQSLRIEIQHNVQLENEVRAFQDRERMEKEIQQLEGTKLWLLYQLAVNQFSEVKKRCEEKDKKIKKEENLLAPRQRELDLIKSKLVHHREEMNKLKSECMKRVDQCKRQYQDAADSVESQLDTLKGQFDAAERREHDRARRLGELRERINGLKRELEESIQRGDDNYEDLNQRLQELEAQRSTINNKICELNAMDDSDRGDLRLAHNQIRAKELELNSMSDFRSSRMKFLERINPELARAVQYFSDPTNLQNAHFRGNIHEPMILFIYVNDLEYGKVAEVCVPRPDLLAYFVEEKEDMKRLMAICKAQNFRISCIHHQMHPQFQKPQANWFSEETMRAFDFQKNLVDLIEAPNYYMSYLCKTIKPQDVLIGTQKTDRAAKEIINNTNLRSFYTLNHMYIVRTSSYTGEKNYSINYIQPARIFTDQINAAERVSVQTELDRAKKDAGRLERQMERRKPMLQELSQKTQEIEKIKIDINTRMTNNKRIKQQLENEERRYRNVEEEKVDLVELRTQHRIKILEAKRGQEQALVRYNKNMNDITLKYVNMLVHTQQSSVLHSAYTRKQRILEEAKETLQTLLAELRELDANKARVADLAKRRKTDAMNKTKEKSAPENVRNGLVHEEELETEINRLQAQLNFLPDTDADVIRDYQARKRRIEDMEKSKEDLEETLRQLEVDMEEGKRTWLEPLKELIGRINSNFGRFFANMQCVGEVSLDHAEDENDFSKYGVKIKVKFRASEPLVELCGWKQSGGERAITTALYILALQELTKVPFRVIDEINQGMDAKNEARFFQLLCTLAQGEDTPQYFLLTPKLLPPVEYPDNVDFHLIFNGPHVDVSKNNLIPVAEDDDDGSLVADDDDDNDVDNESNLDDATTDED